MAKWSNKKKYSSKEMKEKKVKKGTYFFSKTMKHQVIIMIVSVITVCLVLGGSAYAAFTSLSTSDYNTVAFGSLELSYEEDESSVINLTSAYPITDEEGEASNGYQFSIRNTGSLASTYVIYVGSDAAVIKSEECNDNLIDYNDIKINVNNDKTSILKSLATGKYDAAGYEIYKIAEGTLQPGETKKFNVKMWINIDADNSVLGKHFHGKILINGENYNTYTTDALRVWYDGINNTEDGNSTNANTWYDLSGKKNTSSTLVGSNVWKNKGLELHGVIPFVGNINEEYTLSMVVKPNQTGTNPYLIYGDNFPSLYLDSNDNYALTFKGQGLTTKVDPKTILSTEKPSLVTVTYKENMVSVYINATLVSTFNTEQKPNSVATAYLGGNNGSNNLSGMIYNFMLYDRALSVEEIRSNYIIDATRFNMK